MSFADSIASALRQYATFSGRARRSEFWWFFLFQFLVGIAAATIDTILGNDDVFGNTAYGPVGLAVALALFLPGMAIIVRRLHDTDRTGWWILIAFLPIIGAIVLIVFCVFDSTPGPNQYGPSPKHPQSPPPSLPGYAQQ